jgi:NAD(P)-dependent dehydrogenase (short-subunit alcohol dehydrogenase family)
MRRLEGKCILVAGGGGIGAELAASFAREGAKVVLGDLDGQAANAAAAQIQAEGGDAAGVRLDGADEASVAAAVDLCCRTYGGLDGLHANFASFADQGAETGVLGLSLEDYDESMRVNARGFLLCTQKALPHIIARGGGCILYTSSAGAYRSEARVAYGMSKAAGHALMRHVAARFGAQGVRANTIAPGSIMHDKWESERPLLERALSRTPLSTRLGRPLDIAALATLLMSDDGSFITGQVISVDAGLTMRP